MTTALNSDFRDAPTASASSLAKSAIPALAGRILIAPIFLLSGVSKVTAPAMMIGYIQSVGLPVPVLALGIAIAVELLGGVALLLGYHARLVAATQRHNCVGGDTNLSNQIGFIGPSDASQGVADVRRGLGHDVNSSFVGGIERDGIDVQLPCRRAAFQKPFGQEQPKLRR
jgi:hypothetical protein